MQVTDSLDCNCARSRVVSLSTGGLLPKMARLSTDDTLDLYSTITSLDEHSSSLNAVIFFRPTYFKKQWPRLQHQLKPIRRN